MPKRLMAVKGLSSTLHPDVTGINVKQYGAAGDGVTDDTDAIQDAIDVMVDGDTLWFPRGTYVVKAPAPGTYAILVLDKFDIAVAGEGPGESTIKVADACPTYHWLMGGSAVGTDLTGLEISNITFDHNITNNAITNFAEIMAWPEYSCGTYEGANISIHDIEIKNASSVNNVVVNGASCANVSIDRITCTGMGDDPNHIAHDTSVFYIYADTYTVTNCTLDGGDCFNPASVTAIEVHGTDYTVEDNTLSNWEIGMNVVGDGFGGAQNCIIRNNTMTHVWNGIQLWSNTWPDHLVGNGIDGMVIDYNRIAIEPYGDITDTNARSGISVEPWAELDVNDITISHNTITDTLETVAGGSSNACSGIGWISAQATYPTLKNSTIANNTIINFPFCALRLVCSVDTVSITNNIFTNTGSTMAGGVPAYRTPVFIGCYDVHDLDISENTLTDDIAVTRIPYFMYFQEDNSSAGLTVQDNIFSITGDRATFLKHILVADSISQPLITGTISGFTPPTYEVDDASAVDDTFTAFYEVWGQADDPTQDAKDWTFQGSDDDAAWTTLDTQADQVLSYWHVTQHQFSDATQYRYYRLNITANNGNIWALGVPVFRIEFTGTAVWTVGVDQLTWTFTPVTPGAPRNMTTNVLPVPYVASASSEEAGWEAYHAFDALSGDVGNVYWSTAQNGTVTGWLKIDLGA